MRYVSKPSEIEAVQWKGDMDSFRALLAFDSDHVRISQNTGLLELLAGKHGESGWLPVPVGNWIARNADDPTDYWPVEPEHFAKKYEPVKEKMPWGQP